MAHRIEVELTSRQSDGTWTWRAAGARQPKGVLDGSLLHEGAKVGDVVRADADFGVDGITVSAVLAPRPGRTEAARLEIKGPSRPEQPGVTTSLTSRTSTPKTQRAFQRSEGGGDRRDRPERRDRRDRPERRDQPTRPNRDQATTTGSEPSTGNRDERPGATGPERRRDTGRPRPSLSTDGRAGGDRPTRPRAAPDRTGSGQSGNGRRAERHPASASHAGGRQGGPKRFQPATTHRDALVASLPPEQQPIAEQVLRGGLPAVRQAVQAEKQRARAEGLPEVHGEPLVAMAEQLLPRLKAAGWLDRAEAAAAVVDEISLRDLRSVVASADSGGGGNRDEAGRLLATNLRDALSRRLASLQERWVQQIDLALSEGRLLEALRLASHPPDPGFRFPADLAVRLGEAVGASMAPGTPPDKWVALLAAVADSPIRRSVKPAGLPPNPDRSLVEAARRASGRVPGLAGLLGLSMPPPPGPRRPPPPAPGRSAPPKTRRPPPPESAEPTPAEPPSPAEPASGEPISAEPASGEGSDDPVLVEELGHALDQVEFGH